MSRNDDLFARAQQVIPGGVDSPVRAYRSVGGAPRFMVSGRGPYITDAEGRDYVDLVCSWGPLILGHAHPEVVDAVQRAAARGLSFGASTEAETELAEAVVARLGAAVGGAEDRGTEPAQGCPPNPGSVPRSPASRSGAGDVAGGGDGRVRGGADGAGGTGALPIEKVRMVSTGTEATMTAVRLARGVTGRPLIVKFAGLYHGHSDGLLADAGSGLATLALPASAGVTPENAAQTLVLPYNDPDAVRAVFAERGDDIAGIITEAAPANMGVVPPAPGFNAQLARIAHEHGALLILDEVLTGFRVSSAGYWGLEQAAGGAGYTPDLFTFGKVIGGGMPLAALAGRAEVMDQLAPTGPVYQAGTLSGNPVAVAAGLATLRAADAAVYARLDAVADTIASAASAALAAEGVAHTVSRAGNLFSVQFRESPATDYAGVQGQDAFRFGPFFHAMLDAGVSLPPSVYEAWFVSAAHDDAAVSRILDALPAASRAAAAAPAPASD